MSSIILDPDTSARKRAATDVATPPEALAVLASDPNSWVRTRVVKNPATPPGALAVMASDPEIWIRVGVVGHPNTPLETLTELALDSVYSVRRAVADNPTTPPGALSILALDPDIWVRACVVGNPNTSSEIIAKLVRDPDFRVRKAAMARGGMINITPHPINIRLASGGEIVIPPSGQVARVAVNQTAAPGVTVRGLPVPCITQETGEPYGLPPEGTPCIVSAMVAAAVPGRAGVFAPDSGPTAIRDESGRIVAVTRLIRA